MKVEDVALQIYCALVASGEREPPSCDLPTEAEKEALARMSFVYAEQFMAVCQEETVGVR